MTKLQIDSLSDEQLGKIFYLAETLFKDSIPLFTLPPTIETIQKRRGQALRAALESALLNKS